MTLIWLKMTLKSKTGFVLFSTVILGDMPRIYSDRGLQMTGALGGGAFLFLFKKLLLFKTFENFNLRSNLTYFKLINNWSYINLCIKVVIWNREISMIQAEKIMFYSVYVALVAEFDDHMGCFNKYWKWLEILIWPWIDLIWL